MSREKDGGNSMKASGRPFHALLSLDMLSPSMRVLDLEAWSFKPCLPYYRHTLQDML